MLFFSLSILVPNAPKAYVIDPSLFRCERVRVDVEMGSALAAGQTICDRHNLRKREKNATVAYEMDVERFWEMIFGAVEECERSISEEKNNVG